MTTKVGPCPPRHCQIEAATIAAAAAASARVAMIVALPLSAVAALWSSIFLHPNNDLRYRAAAAEAAAAAVDEPSDKIVTAIAKKVVRAA